MSTSSSSRPRRPKTLWIAIAVLAVGLVALNVGLLRERQSGERVEDARSQAVRSAKTLVPTVLSYDYRHLDADLAKAKASTTGRFATEYAGVVDGSLRQVAAKDEVVSKASVTGSSLVTATEDRAVVLLFVTQSTTRAGAKVPTISTSRVQASLALRDGDWLVAGITTV